MVANSDGRVVLTMVVTPRKVTISMVKILKRKRDKHGEKPWKKCQESYLGLKSTKRVTKSNQEGETRLDTKTMMDTKAVMDTKAAMDTKAIIDTEAVIDTKTALETNRHTGRTGTNTKATPVSGSAEKRWWRRKKKNQKKDIKSA
ncbi:hypothetical protein BJX64DRAFT_288813 [Aspergillus heterothallicus]